MTLLGYLGSILVVVLALAGVVIFYKQRARLRRKQALAELHAKWGQEQPRERDFQTMGEFHQICPPLWGAGIEPIDNQTWNDLNMDAVHAKVDRTCTTAGECLLYHILRSPLGSLEQLAGRGRIIGVFEKDQRTRDAVQLQLLAVGRANARGLISLVWNPPPPPHPMAWMFKVLTALAVASLVIAIAFGHSAAILLIFLMFIVNMSVHYRFRAGLLGRLSALRQLGALIRAGEVIAKIESPESVDRAALLANATANSRRIAARVEKLLPEGSASGDLILTLVEYVSIFFLHEVRTFQAVLADLGAHQDDIRTIFRVIGELDAWQSIASYRSGAGQFCEPQFNEDGPRMEIRDGRHPLLAEPVPNSIEIQRAGIAITGSNMSGKTTFLRTVGVNALLAQTIYTCLAASYRARILRIISSMNEVDSLVEGKSYYLAEAERLLKMVRESESPQLILALIDEPLAGTNSPERLAASREILRYLTERNGLVMVSTHDVELVSQLQQQGLYEAWHFADQADDQGIRFDYRLHKGLDYHGNAIKVLKFLGYPDAIVDAANGALGRSP